MAEVDVLRAQVVRLHTNQPWGFRLEGGIDSGKPLTILRVTPASPADKIGLRSGDAVVEIGDTPTDNLTHQQAVDLVSSHGDTLLLTLERRARGSVPTNPVLAQVGADGSAPLKHYQTFDMSGGSGGRKFHIVQSQPFHATKPQQVGPSVPGGPRLISQPPPGQYQSQQAQYQQQTFYQSQPQYQPQPVQYQQQPQYQPQQVQYQASHDPYQPSQSRTFRNIQGIMEYSGPAAGTAGLPPQRSLYQERLKEEEAARRAGSPRVRVLMPQQYNTPMGLYSASNVMDTFQSQTSALLDEIDKAQHAHPETYHDYRVATTMKMSSSSVRSGNGKSVSESAFTESRSVSTPQRPTRTVTITSKKREVTPQTLPAGAAAAVLPIKEQTTMVSQNVAPSQAQQMAPPPAVTSADDKIKIYFSSITVGSKNRIKQNQDQIFRIMDAKKIPYEKIDIATSPDARTEMRELARNPTALPPRFVKGDQYLGGYDDFEMAVEMEDIMSFFR